MKILFFLGIFFVAFFSAQASVVDTIRIDTAKYNKIAAENKQLNNMLESFANYSRNFMNTKIKELNGLRSIPLANRIKLNETALDSLKPMLEKAQDFEKKLALHLSELIEFDKELNPKKKEKKAVVFDYRAKADEEMPIFFQRNTKSKEKIEALVADLTANIDDFESGLKRLKKQQADGYE